MANSTKWTLHSEGKFLEIKLFLTHFCLKLEQVFITWYFTISRKKTMISFSKAVKNIFVFNSVTDSTKLESADSGGWINIIK